MESYESNDMKMDEEFRSGLQAIRGYLGNLTTPREAKCCGEWLVRLRESGATSKELRNVLLRRLTAQVSSGRLHYPFNRLPPHSDTPLSQIYEEGDATSWCTEYESSTKSTTETSAQEGQSNNAEEEENIYPSIIHKQHPDIPSNNILQQVQNESMEREMKLLRDADKQTKGNFSKLKSEADKKRMEVEKLKSCLEDYKSLLLEYKRAVNESLTDLSQRLDSAVNNNHVQKSDLKHLQTSMHQCWSAKIESLENELISEVSKLECQLEADRNKYELKIEQLKLVITEKDERINSLDQKIKQQAITLKEKMNSVKDEINLVTKGSDLQYKKKYNFLKKQIIKTEKINKDLIKQYEKNIVMTVKDYEAKMQSVKMEAADESMMEVEGKVRQLEESYRRIFQEYKQKNQDEKIKEIKKFQELRELKILK